MRLNRIYVPVVLVTVLAPCANAQFIDNFKQGPVDLKISGGTGYKESQQLGSNSAIVGGQRDLLFSVNSNPYGRSAEFTVDPLVGASFLSSGPGVTTHVKLDYDGLDAEGNDGVLSPSPNGLNLNLSNANRFAFDFLFADLGVQTTIDAYTYGGGHSRGTFKVPGQTTSPKTFDISTGAFTTVGANGAVNWKDVDRIIVSFDGKEQALDFGLASIRAVPEPASVAALALGLFGALSRRRRNRQA